MGSHLDYLWSWISGDMFCQCCCLSVFFKDKVAEGEEFFATRTKPFIARTWKQSLERVHINTKWVQSIPEEKSFAEVIKELAHRNY